MVQDFFHQQYDLFIITDTIFLLAKFTNNSGTQELVVVAEQRGVVYKMFIRKLIVFHTSCDPAIVVI